MARLRPYLPALLGASLGALFIAWLGLSDWAWNDYAVEVAPSFDALRHGDLGGFFALAPSYGGSIVVRAPFALLPGLWGGGELAVYRMVALPAFMASVALAVWLDARMRAHGQPAAHRVAAVALCAAGPVAQNALDVGHSEEILAAVLCVGAMLFALRERTVWAALALGIAVAVKPWALVAVVPVLLALGPRWWRAALVAGLTTAAILAPIAFGASERFHATTTSLAATGSVYWPQQAWWFLGSNDQVVRGPDGKPRPGYRTSPTWVPRVTHPLIVLIGVLVPLLWLRRRRGRDPGDLLLVLALMLHLRCLLDPWNIEYYALPMLLALLTWEAAVRRRMPVVTLALTLVLWGSWHFLNGLTPDQLSAVYLAWAVPLAAGLALRAFAPLTRARSEAALAAPAAA